MTYEKFDATAAEQTIKYSHDGRERQNFIESLDCHEEILELEFRHRALDYIKEQYCQPELDSKERALAPIISPRHGVEDINNQFARRILPAFLQDDSHEGLKMLRSLEAYTTDEEMALLIHDEEFHCIHDGLKSHLTDSVDTIMTEVADRLSPSGQLRWNDRYQFNGVESKRSLAAVERTGIETKIDREAHDQITAAFVAVKDTQLPISEFLKNERIVSVNGFNDSKVSLVVHDAMDHAWGFQLLKKSGLDQKFSAFFKSIGDPMHTDMFKREGEIVSSIGFGVRYGSTQENGFRPIYTHNAITQLFDEHLINDQLNDRHMEAYKILRSLSPNSREALSLGFTYSNYVTELDEQRRKHGKIKVRDALSDSISGELSATDPDFMSLFVEFHHEILKSSNKHRDNLFRFQILLEEYLQGIAAGSVDIAAPLVIRVQELDQYDYSQTTLSSDKLRWMFKHYGYMASKGSLI